MDGSETTETSVRTTRNYEIHESREKMANASLYIELFRVFRVFCSSKKMYRFFLNRHLPGYQASCPVETRSRERPLGPREREALSSHKTLQEEVTSFLKPGEVVRLCWGRGALRDGDFRIKAVFGWMYVRDQLLRRLNHGWVVCGFVIY